MMIRFILFTEHLQVGHTLVNVLTRFVHVTSASSTPTASNEGGHGVTHPWFEGAMPHHLDSPPPDRLYGARDRSGPPQPRRPQGLACPLVNPDLRVPGR